MVSQVLPINFKFKFPEFFYSLLTLHFLVALSSYRTKYQNFRNSEVQNLTTFELIPNIAFGYFYSIHSEALTGSTEDAKDADKVAKACYAAAIIYAIFVGFCGLQVSFFLCPHNHSNDRLFKNRERHANIIMYRARDRKRKM